MITLGHLGTPRGMKSSRGILDFHSIGVELKLEAESWNIL